MKVTIITATYNSATTIDSCLESVLSQSYPNLEYIIVDGKSTDKTLDIVRRKSVNHPEIKIFSEKDKGIYDALNKGISLATGDIIGFVNSDDFLSGPGIIADIVEEFKTNNADGVYGDLHYVKREDTSKIVRFWKSSFFSPKMLNNGWMPAHPTLYLRKSVYQKHGNFNLNYRIAGDYDFMLRILKDPNLKFSYLPQVISKMRLGGVSNASVKTIFQKSKEDYMAMKSNGLSFPLLVLLKKNVSKIQQFIN